MHMPVSLGLSQAPLAIPNVHKPRLHTFANCKSSQLPKQLCYKATRVCGIPRASRIFSGRGASNDNPFVTNQSREPSDDDWPSPEDEKRRQPKSQSLDLSLPTLGKEIPAKVPFPLMTKLLVGTMIVLFLYQWWPFLTNFQHQSSFITNATHTQRGPSGFLPALRHLTLGIPEPGHWSDITVKFMLDRRKIFEGEYWRFYTTTLLHANLLHLMANCLAVHEFGKELESRVGRTQFVSVLVFAAYASGLVMIGTGRPTGAEAYLPVGASGLVTGITGSLLLLSLFLKDLRKQGTLESSGVALVIAFLLGQFVPALDNGVHLGGLFGGLAAAVIILIWYGIRGLFRGRRTTTANT